MNNFAVMKKMLLYIITFASVLLFLISFAGVSFIVHHCSENHTSKIHLFVNDYKCEHEQEHNASCCNFSKSQTSCTKIKHNHQCCSNKKGFIKIVDKFNFSRENFNFDYVIVTGIIDFGLTNYFSSISNLQINYHDPPKLYGGKELIRLISVFLI